MGKSSAPIVGYWYRVLFHAGLSTRIDAFLEFRAGDKTAWSGELTASGTLSINAPNLFGGEKDQGGIVGDVDVMFGEAAQVPNAYLLANLGSQVPAWRGLATLVFKGGRYGAMNPYPQKPSFKFCAIKNGWDSIGAGTCWYPDKAEIALTADTTLPSDASGWEYQVLPDETNPGYNNLTVPTSGWSENGQAPFGAGPANGPINTAWANHTILWIKRTVTIGALNQKLIVGAENGCVIFINGAIAGAVNRDNVQIVHNEDNIFTFDLQAGSTYEIAVKAFDEAEILQNDITYLTISISAPGLTAMNPAHILYYARTHPDLCDEVVANINDASFRAAADWFYSQGFGLCTEYDPGSETPDAFIQRIEQLCACASDRSPVDGQWYLDIANGVYDINSLPILTDDDILDFSESPSLLDDTVNSVSVEYSDPQIKDTVITPPVIALALVTANGEIPVVNQHNEIPTGDLAVRVALRDLQSLVTPTHAFELTTTRKPYAWRRNTYFRLQCQKRGIADMVCILAETQTGTLKSGAIKLKATQDIYSLPVASFVQVEPGVDTRPSQIPLGIIDQAAFEAPYIQVVQSLSRSDLAALPSDVGYAMAVAKDPGKSLDYTLQVSLDGGATYAGNTIGHFCPSASIVEGDALSDAAPATAFTLSGGTLLGSVVLGSAALWDGEIVRVDALDTTVTPNTLTLGRGCADTPPTPHAANSRIFFYDGFFAGDITEYTSGETIEVELLTNTGSQQLDPSLASPIAITFDGRQFKPYPPAQVKLNNAWYPSAIATGTISATWVDRNRISQTDQLLDTTAAGVAIEPGTTYTAQTLNSGGGVIDSVTGISAGPYTFSPAPDGDYIVEIFAVRAGVAGNAHQIPTHVTGTVFTPVANFYSGENGAWYDPSDFSTMFQDAAGTTPVTATGQSVGLLKDKSGNGYHLSQATSAARPVLQQDTSSDYYLQFTGASSQYLVLATPNGLAPHKNSIMSVSGVKFDDATAGHTIYARSVAAGDPARYANSRNASGLLVALYDASGAGGVSAGAADTATTIRVVSAVVDRVAGNAQVRVNGATLGSVLSFTPDSTNEVSSSYRFLVGAYNNATDSGQINYLNGRLYGLVLRLSPTIDSVLLGKNEQWMAAKAGISF